MPEYLHPDVYPEEVPSGPSPIEGVSTSTTGMVGVTRFGPTSGKPVLVTSFGDFTRTFGGYWDEKSLTSGMLARWSSDPDEGGRWWQFPLSVRGFFENGGARLYVKRVVASGAAAAQATCGAGVMAQITRADGLSLTLSHLIGAQAGQAIRFYDRAGKALADNGATFARVELDRQRATLDRAVPGLGPGGFVELVRRQPGALKIYARSPGSWGNGLRVEVGPMYGTGVRLAPFPDGRRNFSANVESAELVQENLWYLIVQPGDVRVGDRLLSRGSTYPVTDVADIDAWRDLGPRIGLTVQGDGGWSDNPVVVTSRDAHRPNGTSLYVRGGSALYAGALAEISGSRVPALYRIKAVDGDRIELDPVTPLPDGATYVEGDRLRLIEVAVEVRYTEADGRSRSEAFANLRPVDSDHPMAIATHLQRQSKLISARIQGPIGGGLGGFPTSGPELGTTWMTLGRGRDDLESLTVDDFVGRDGGSGNRTGILSMEDVPEIALCLAPGMWSESVQQALIGHASGLKDRFVVLDTQVGIGIQEVQTARSTLSSSYAGLYYPWIEVRDPLRGESVPLAPSGHVAGLIARVDNERGVHKAPANEVVRGITGIAQDVNDREQDLLNPIGINCLRSFPGRGHRVWGARTLASDPAWKYVNVRRLFLFVETSIANSTQWVIFEPNADPLWARVRQSISNFLRTLWRDGMLFGKKAEEAFFVRCDRSTMTQDDIDNGRLICQIGIAPVKPAEFVILRFQQKTRDTQG